jgi:hypothetical protein
MIQWGLYYSITPDADYLIVLEKGSIMKSISHQEFARKLKSGGFYIERSGKHTKWTNGKISIFVPNKHSGGGMSLPLAKRLLREAGLEVAERT